MTKEAKVIVRRGWIAAAVIVSLALLTAVGLSIHYTLYAETQPAETTQPKETLPPNLYGPGDFSYDENGFLTCSAGESVLGIEPEQSIETFLGGLPGRYRPAEGPCKMQGCVFTVETTTGKCLGVERIDIR